MLSSAIVWEKHPVRIEHVRSDTNRITRSDMYSVFGLITLCSRSENRTEDILADINMFETGLRFIVPLGYYVELYADPSLISRGYMFQVALILDHTTLSPPGCI